MMVKNGSSYNRCLPDIDIFVATVIYTTYKIWILGGYSDVISRFVSKQ